MSWYAIRRHWLAEARKNNDRLECGLCGRTIHTAMYNKPHPESLEIDHIIPKALGGRDRLDNTQPAHRICNSKKQDDQYALGVLKTTRDW